MKTTTSSRKLIAAAALTGATLLQAMGATTSAPWAKAATAWNESVALEKKADYAGALAKMVDFAQAGGDPYLVEVRSGWLTYSNKDYQNAAKHYEAAAQANPNAVTPLLGLANSYRALNDISKAEKAAAAALLRDPANYTALSLIAGIALDQKDHRKSSQYYEAILKMYPEDTTALSGEGWSLLYLTRKPEAALAFQRLLVLSPSYPYALQGYEAASKTFAGNAR